MAISYFITGSYTEIESPAKAAAGKGIALYSFDNTSGKCELQTHIPLRNPSYPRYFKQTNKIYAAEELMDNESPVLATIDWNGSNQLSISETINIPGSHACHPDICKNDLAIANYTSGDVTLINLANKRITTIKHEGKSIDPENQQSPHPHMIYPLSDNRFLVPDLGIDKVLIYESSADGQWKSTIAIDTPPGSGPRHVICSQDQHLLIVLGELRANVILYKKAGNTYQPVDEVKLPDGAASGAAIRLHPSGNFFYVSERATNKIFSMSANEGRLNILSSFSCAGETPRDISIDPSGQWLLSSNQDSNTLAVFKIDTANGNLTFSHHLDEPSPVCVSWLV